MENKNLIKLKLYHLFGKLARLLIYIVCPSYLMIHHRSYNFDKSSLYLYYQILSLMHTRREAPSCWLGYSLYRDLLSMR